jgi:outer membrane protein OmpA-like peptidoglycan-associated protein
MKKTLLFSLAGILLAACSSTNVALEEAKSSYELIASDPVVQQKASVALYEAKQTLDKAQNVSDDEEKTHLAYIAKRQAEMARLEAQSKVAEEEKKKLLEERDRILLESKNQQVAQTEQRAKALEAELEALKAKQTERGPTITLGDVLFDLNKASLKPGAMQNLYRLVDFLKENPGYKVVIEGHTDSTGSESYNMDLSLRRAESVRDFLVSNGIAMDRIVTRGYGPHFPVATNATEAGRQRNRRVEVILVEPGKTVPQRLGE